MRERLESGRKASWPGRRRKCGAPVASDRLKRRQLGERSGRARRFGLASGEKQIGRAFSMNLSLG